MGILSIILATILVSPDLFTSPVHVVDFILLFGLVWPLALVVFFGLLTHYIAVGLFFNAALIVLFYMVVLAGYITILFLHREKIYLNEGEKPDWFDVIFGFLYPLILPEEDANEKSKNDGVSLEKKVDG